MLLRIFSKTMALDSLIRIRFPMQKISVAIGIPAWQGHSIVEQ
jgi:hypothetical protein